MQLRNLSRVDIRHHFKKNSSYYFSFLVFALFGIVIGTIVVCGGDSYIHILTSESKVLYGFINGTAGVSGIFWKKFLGFFVPILLVFLLSLNYYLSLTSFVIVTYQSALLIMSSAALISIYGFSGVLNVLFLLLPINLLYMALLIVFSVICISRSKQGAKSKYFAYGFNDEAFWLQIVLCVLVALLLAFVATVILPIFLKNAIFIIY